MATFVQQTGAANPFNGVDVGYNSTPDFVDLDGDGDFDAVVGIDFDAAVADGTGRVYYFENTGTALAPVFTQQTGAANPFDSVVEDNSGPKSPERNRSRPPENAGSWGR